MDLPHETLRMIEVEGLAKSFGSTQAVVDASFRAEDGKITGLLGPNGAGKSTTLRILSTVLRPDRGRARIGGIDVVEEPNSVRRVLGVLPHGSGLYQHLSARENIRYYGRLQGVATDAIESRIDAMIETLDLGSIADRRAKGFSQGERTKVALARALIHAPSHVLLDEPSSGLDVMANRRLRDYIRKLRDDGCCVVLSSHVMQEVASLCDEVVVVAEGRVVAEGTPEQLLERAGVDGLEEAFVRLVGGEASL